MATEPPGTGVPAQFHCRKGATLLRPKDKSFEESPHKPRSFGSLGELHCVVCLRLSAFACVHYGSPNESTFIKCLNQKRCQLDFGIRVLVRLSSKKQPQITRHKALKIDVLFVPPVSELHRAGRFCMNQNMVSCKTWSLPACDRLSPHGHDRDLTGCVEELSPHLRGNKNSLHSG